MAKKKKKDKSKADTYYRPVPGSGDLATSSLSDREIEGIEDPSFLTGKRPFRIYAGEWLGKAEVGQGTLLPVEVFDSLAARLTPLEQSVFYQLVRHSLGQARNFCRTGKRELMGRTGISERRLLVALDGLVRKGRIKPLHRNNHGTLYRIYMPGESPSGGREGKPASVTAKTSRASLGAPEYNGATYYDDPPNIVAKIGGGTVPAEKKSSGTAREQGGGPDKTKKAARRKPGAASPPRPRPLESPLNEERFAGTASAKAPSISVGEIVGAYFKATRKKPSADERDEAVSEVTALLEDGYSREEALRAVKWFGEKFPNEKDLSRLAYYIHQALSEGN